MKISEIISIYDFGPVQMGSESFSFRIEIHRELGKASKLFAKIWRHETYRLQSTFPQANGRPSDEPSDETIIVEEFSFKTEPKHYAESSLSLLENIILEMADRFGENQAIKRNLRLLKKHLEAVKNK
jgi:hypothetical protein